MAQLQGEALCRCFYPRAGPPSTIPALPLATKSGSFHGCAAGISGLCGGATSMHLCATAPKPTAPRKSVHSGEGRHVLHSAGPISRAMCPTGTSRGGGDHLPRVGMAPGATAASPRSCPQQGRVDLPSPDGQPRVQMPKPMPLRWIIPEDPPRRSRQTAEEFSQKWCTYRGHRWPRATLKFFVEEVAARQRRHPLAARLAPPLR